MAPPITLPQGVSLTGYRSPQDHATDTGTGSITKMKSCSIKSLFSYQSPSQNCRWFVHARAQRLELRNMDYEYNQQLDSQSRV